ncbi:UDP-glucose 6-dehydrogenase [Candidatus Gottesmanbacteria bacterium RBG_16_52_11]|uniref:UDP-glucose 6-dehydrogenase n=1 Tax=Candidatus Gottesmanbacteria bacterium RBG_16_52_11 TaxID=1798374 RepID=A0A1F5YML6_9BACT|nr:MAG: UDP-glucose 6-dehydrogenase [Candidatus Gottesmanbacteria bacterium RBG_16_52_11]
MTIAFIGHGYVGLVTAAVFADLGNTVWVVGRNRKKVENLKKGVMPFFEPGLEELVRRNTTAGRLIFTLSYEQAVKPSQIIFICVGTPSGDNGEADLSDIFSAADNIGKAITGYKVIVTKSTVPPGTNRKVAETIQKVKPDGSTFAIASVPEFLREGTAISDTLHPDRLVIGTTSDRAFRLLTELHKGIQAETVFTNVETAELIKYASNALLSTKISFANAIAFLSENVGADVESVLTGVGLDRRIGRSFLYPGVGYGGSCFPKDVKALIALARKAGYDFKLLKAVEEINREAGAKFVEKVKKHFNGAVGSVKLAVLGLSFKPDTDDMRQAPSIRIISDLVAAGAQVSAYDPIAMTNAREVLPKSVTYAANAYAAAGGADAVLILTEWNEFRQLDLVKLARSMKQLVMFDGRNIYDPVQVKNLGFSYYGVGRM